MDIDDDERPENTKDTIISAGKWGCGLLCATTSSSYEVTYSCINNVFPGSRAEFSIFYSGFMIEHLYK
jgi:hypothetical protein